MFLHFAKKESPLAIVTGLEENEIVHPDIYYNEDGIFGHVFWLVASPLPLVGGDAYENPFVFVSENGIDWVTPDGLSNPLTQKPTSGHNADPSLIFNGTKLFVFYLRNDYASATPYKINRIESVDGVNWENDITVFAYEDKTVSPAVHFSSEDDYIMWVVKSDGLTTATGSLVKKISEDGTTWGEDVVCSIVGLPPNFYIWHINIKKINNNAVWEGVATCASSKTGDVSLFYVTSNDGITFTTEDRPILSCSKNGNKWDNLLYQSCLLKINGKYALWYSGADSLVSNTTFKIGYTEELSGSVLIINKY